jgi:hypothetical protein
VSVPGYTLQAPCSVDIYNQYGAFAAVLKIDPVVEVVEMWESRRDFQEEWKGWEAGAIACHAFHSSSSPPRRLGITGSAQPGNYCRELRFSLLIELETHKPRSMSASS